jgi:hypothetical protein
MPWVEWPSSDDDDENEPQAIGSTWTYPYVSHQDAAPAPPFDESVVLEGVETGLGFELHFCPSTKVDTYLMRWGMVLDGRTAYWGPPTPSDRLAFEIRCTKRDQTVAVWRSDDRLSWKVATWRPWKAEEKCVALDYGRLRLLLWVKDAQQLRHFWGA